MKKIIFLIIVYPLFVTSNLCAQNLSKNEVFDVLSKWEGKWKTSVVFEESVWVSKGYETRGITNSKLILSNNYIEMMVKILGCGCVLQCCTTQPPPDESFGQMLYPTNKKQRGGGRYSS